MSGLRVRVSEKASPNINREKPVATEWPQNFMEYNGASNTYIPVKVKAMEGTISGKAEVVHQTCFPLTRQDSESDAPNRFVCLNNHSKESPLFFTFWVGHRVGLKKVLIHYAFILSRKLMCQINQT